MVSIYTGLSTTKKKGKLHKKYNTAKIHESYLGPLPNVGNKFTYSNNFWTSIMRRPAAGFKH